MRLLLHNALTDRLEELRPEAPPRILFEEGEGGPRQRLFVSCLKDALAYLGYAVTEAGDEAVELYCGHRPPPRAVRFWLKVEEAGRGGDGPSLEARPVRGLRDQDLRMLCLKTHYRTPLGLTWSRLEEARLELEAFKEAARRLSSAAGASASSPSGLAGYTKRFRDALARDLDFTEALAGLWDGLRPGALSPGSQLGLLREAQPALGLKFFD